MRLYIIVLFLAVMSFGCTKGFSPKSSSGTANLLSAGTPEDLISNPPGPLPADGAESPTGRRPKMFWTPQRQFIFNKMKNENHSWWQLIQSNAECSNTPCERYVDTGRWGALAYQITGDPKYARKAWEVASRELRVPGEQLWYHSHNYTRESIIEHVFVYDWILPALTQTERSRYITFLNYLADLCLDKVPSMPWGSRFGDSDEVIGQYMGTALIATVTADTNSRAKSFLTETLKESLGIPYPFGGLDMTSAFRGTMRNEVGYYMSLGKGGQWIEGSAYNLGTTQLLMMGAEGIKTATGQDHFPEVTSYTKELALTMIHEITPDLKHAFQWGDVEDARSLLSWSRAPLYGMLAGFTQGDPIGPVFHGFFMELQDKNPHESFFKQPNARHFYFYNPYAPKATDWRTKVSNYHVSEGQGIVLSRTGWTDSDSLLAVHNPPNGVVDHAPVWGHDYQLYRKGEWAITHPGAYAPESAAVNTVLIAGSGGADEARGMVAEERGANGEYTYTATTTGGGPSFYYVWGGYGNPPPVFIHEDTRSILYLSTDNKSSDTMIIHNRVYADNPKNLPGYDRYYPDVRTKIEAQVALKQWIIHMPMAPTISGKKVNWQTAGGQKVNMETLLPLQTQTKVQNEAVELLNGYFSAPERNFYNIRLYPSVEQAFDTFLNVLEVSDATSSTTNTLIKSDQGSPVDGVVVARSGQNNVIAMFSAQVGQKLTASVNANGIYTPDPTLHARLKKFRILDTGYSFSASTSTSTTDLYLMDLNSAKAWTITVDQGSPTALTVSSQGVARFKLMGAGSHRLTLESH